MAYDLELAKRIRRKMANLPSLEEKKMFGGVGFLINGNMACGVNKNDMIVRVDPEKYTEVEREVPFARPFAISGKPMKGWIAIAPEGLRTDKDLNRWVQEGVDFAQTLPPKKK